MSQNNKYSGITPTPLIGIKAKPFLKWAGGKTQLLASIVKLVPLGINRYVEPFIGGGAVFFELAQTYPISQFIISDLNPELFMAYSTIKYDVSSLIDILLELRYKYLSLTPEDQKIFYYQIRTEFNETYSHVNLKEFNDAYLIRTAQLIFLNHTCFNGLFRINSRGAFNVPFGSYRNPSIFDENNLKAISVLLNQTIILLGDYTKCERWINDQTLVYFDPPYRPISKTASFNGYLNNSFDDQEQVRLSLFFRKLDKIGAKLILSNSDPKNYNTTDNFFDDLYQGFTINRVSANRAINSKGSKRGAIMELIITNY